MHLLALLFPQHYPGQRVVMQRVNMALPNNVDPQKVRAALRSRVPATLRAPDQEVFVFTRKRRSQSLVPRFVRVHSILLDTITIVDGIAQFRTSDHQVHEIPWPEGSYAELRAALGGCSHPRNVICEGKVHDVELIEPFRNQDALRSMFEAMDERCIIADDLATA